MQEVQTNKLQPGTLPLSQGIQHGDLVFVSGNIPEDPDTGEIIGGDIEAQTTQVLDNIASILEEAGASTDDIIKTTVFLTDSEDFDGFNRAYGEYLSDPYPARSALVVELMGDFDVEIEAVAVVE